MTPTGLFLFFHFSCDSKEKKSMFKDINGCPKVLLIHLNRYRINKIFNCKNNKIGNTDKHINLIHIFSLF